MDRITFAILFVAVFSLAIGWSIGYSQGRRVGYMVGEELERRKWKRMRSILWITPSIWRRRPPR
jgi:hypothetical protein